MQDTSRTCQLRYFQFPKYSDPITEPIVSADGALARIEEIQSQYISKEGECATVYIENFTGDKLHVGLAGDLWMVTHIHRTDEYECEYQYALGDKKAEGTIPFLFPEWTDVSRQRVIPKAKGQRVVEQWIESGVLSNCVEWTYDLR